MITTNTNTQKLFREGIMYNNIIIGIELKSTIFAHAKRVGRYIGARKKKSSDN